MNRSAAHTALVKEILMTYGATDGLLLVINECGRARYMSGNGKEFFVPYGFPTSNGGPDILGVVAPDARLFGLEIKTGKAKASKDQKSTHQGLLRFGVRVYVVHSLEEAGEAIDEVRSWS
jgi:hypothetical protein